MSSIDFSVVSCRREPFNRRVRLMRDPLWSKELVEQAIIAINPRTRISQRCQPRARYICYLLGISIYAPGIVQISGPTCNEQACTKDAPSQALKSFNNEHDTHLWLDRPAGLNRLWHEGAKQNCKCSEAPRRSHGVVARWGDKCVRMDYPVLSLGTMINICLHYP